MANFFDQFDMETGGSQQPSYADAIAGIESRGSGNYRAVGPATRSGDRALGRYQVMSQNIRPWSREILGREVTPSEFMSDPNIQDQIFEGKFGQYVQKYGPEGAARAWFAGEEGMNHPNRRDSLGTSVADYSRKFTGAMGFTGQPQPRTDLPPMIANGRSAPAPQSAPSGGNFFDQFDEAPSAQPQAAPPSTSGRPRVVINTDDFGKRFDAAAQLPVDNAAELQAGLVNRGAQMTAQPRDNFSQIFTDFENQGAAAGQRTTPNIAAQSKNLISADVQEGDDGNAYYIDPASGRLLPTDSNKHVVLRDPADGRLKVFARTDSTDEGVLSSAGRLLGTGLATGSPVSRVVGPAVEAAQAPGRQVVEAGQRLAVDVPRAIASDRTSVQRIGQGIRNIPVVGDAIPRATQQLTDDLGGAVQRVAGEFGQGSGPNVANRVGNTVASAAEAETAAATRAARQTDEAATAAWEAANTGRAQALDATDAQALQKARQAVGDMSPQDMGQAITARLRAGEQAARARKEELYRAAGESKASIEAGAAQGAVSRVAQSLENEGIVVDPVLTPVASRMFDEVRKLGELRSPNKAVGARLPASGNEKVAAISIQGIERTRKVLNFLRQGASNDADRRAANGVVREFDKWLDDAFDSALFSGSDEALNAIKSARKANAEWRSKFFNTADDAGKVINKIVTGEVTPQEVSNWLIGASKVGSKGVSSRLLTRIAEATGNDAEAMQAIRGGIWNRLSQSTGGVEAKAGPKVANEIYEFLNGSGRDIANRLFTPEQRGIMKAYADTVRSTASQREALPAVAKASKPRPTEVGVGPMQELANTVLGRNGRTDEALFAAINSYAKSGGRGDIQTLARIVKALPEQDRGDLAGSIIRQIGISPRTGQFSPDVFASQWRTYTPQAKTILFGNAGPHRQALDDIMTISERMKQVGSRFGNPSGTAQNRNFFAMGAGAMAAPLTTMTAVIGGWPVAKILASPAGAASAAKWTRAYSALRLAPSTARLVAFETASRNLANTAGINVSSADFIRAVQGTVPGSAEDE